MRKGLAYLMCLSLIVATGCGGLGARGRAVFVPVVEKPADSSWPFAFPATEEGAKEATKGGRRIRIATWFIAAHPSDLGKLGVDCEKPFSVITGTQHAKLLDELLRSRRARLVTAPQLTVVPGEAASVAATTRYDYVGDYRRGKADAQGREVYAPVVQKVLDGLALKIRAELDGDQIVFTTIEPRMASSLGMRDCKSFVNLGNDVMLMVWQEPVFLAAEGALPAGERLAYRRGTAIAVPLQHTLRITKAKVRDQLACPVEVMNAEGLKFLSQVDRRGYALPGRVVVLLAARPATEKDDAPAPPKP